MNTIWKFPLEIGEFNIIQAPAAAPVVLVALDPASGRPAVWINLDPAEPRRDRYFSVHGTGHDVDPGELHRGSVVQGPFVWHVFEAVA